ncbi:unnamed protein product [Moneuplotes crassus]|uniref:Uncharacterized protein n=1 Tax=Euplotes crassus TaxID=5936 RepID=A0AAD1XF27_EUPCR|nr:unnamed protein product [Moneuplotes crassus]
MASDCGTLTKRVYYSGQTWNTTRSYITSNVVCVYKLTSTSIYINGIKIDVTLQLMIITRRVLCALEAQRQCL